jgi:hypothetical protein
MPFGVDVQCKCGHVRYILLNNSSADPDPEDAKCPECGSKKFTRLLGGNFGSYESSDQDTKSEILKQRSFDHTKRTAKENVERIIETGRQKQRR